MSNYSGGTENNVDYYGHGGYITSTGTGNNPTGSGGTQGNSSGGATG